MATIQRHPDHPEAQPKPGDTVVWHWDGSDKALPEIPHTGSCHCGAVQFRFPHPDLTKQEGWHFPVKSCNCSICERNGYLTIFAERKDIVWIRGWDEMTSYQFATGKKVHRFCGKCGSSVCIDFLGEWKAAGDVIGINARMLENVNIEALYLHKKDGKGFVPGS
ncbi:hypothetical protein N0V82_006129 [Gnomoniopsis sp. IMI 355080]|nr:hypothetical protein N0V82_006129 [Gnomoniopsis sp. IMI 355080]